MLNWFLFVIYLICILFLHEWILHECGCLLRQKKVVGPLDLKQRQLRAPQLVLGTEPGSSAGATALLTSEPSRAPVQDINVCYVWEGL